MSEKKIFRTGDHVRHKSGEEWVVAHHLTEGTRDDLYPCGWPCSIARGADCELIEAASDEESDSLLREIAEIPGSDPRREIAQSVLKSRHSIKSDESVA